ncbi:ABC-three component system protein [Xanthomonas arboricola]|uniref:ABC-three component system protein n=1 Tax=Xanthomonas arboricola TaxID=56448 RepID=UPI000F8F42C3|nr:ABC-three component system protein [Xanthomonas arboricola]RYF51281.1 MAG: hypothetical protein EOO38_03625 [Cytophagaceae bacterium]
MLNNQKGASAGGDLVGRDKVEHNHYYASLGGSAKVERLKAKLQQEIDQKKQVVALIDRLKSYQPIEPEDGIKGLEAKLEKAGRSPQKLSALRMKEQFAKLLERWSLYGSAQEIFVHVLALTELRFTNSIYPHVGDLNNVQIDELVEQKILTPIVEEIGVEVFSMDHMEAMGMIYWLAEQCRIRWHQ